MRPLLSAQEFPKAIEDLAARIKAVGEKSKGELAIIGIHTRGVPLAKRLVHSLEKSNTKVNYGMLDINLYRDDLSTASDQPVLKETKIEFDLTGKIVFLADDVLYTGRTIRAAMDAIFDLGRPKAVHLVVMAKRNGRELPIDTEFTALDVPTQDTDNIKVKFLETDGKDDVSVLEVGEY